MRIIFLILILFTTTAKAQKQFLGTPDNTVQVRNALDIRNFFKLPYRDTTNNPYKDSIGSVTFFNSIPYFSDGSSWNSFNYIPTNYLTTLSALQSSNFPQAKQIVITDTLLGGTFSLYTGPEAIDTSIIYRDAVGRKWRRNIKEALDIRWFGAVENGPDCYYALQKAILYQQYHKGTYVYIPSKPLYNTYYYCGSPLVINRGYSISTIIKGDVSTPYFPSSYLRFASNITGITLNVGGDLTIYDLRADHIGVPTDTLAHVINLHSIGKFYNVDLGNSAGNALNIEACDQPSYLYPNTNADLSTFKDCHFHNSLNGAFLQGCDANIILFENVSVVNNKHWGLYTDGFLGSTFLQCHSSSNGANTDVLVTYNGRGYVAINNIGTSNINHIPDEVNSVYWAISEGYGTRAAWSSTKNYYSGGAYCSTNSNAKDLFLNCYSEPYQPPSRYAARGLVIGGLNGAGTIGGMLLTATDGFLNVTGRLVTGGYIQSNDNIYSKEYFVSGTGLLGSGYWTYDGRDTRGTGIYGDSSGFKIYVGGIPRVSINRVNGNMNISSNASTYSPYRLNVDGDINVVGNINQNGSPIGNGTGTNYTPTGTIISNTSSIGTLKGYYSKNGSTVTVTIQGSLTPTTTGTVEISLSLPLSNTMVSGAQMGSCTIAENAGTNYAPGEVKYNSASLVNLKYKNTVNTTSNFAFTLNYPN